MHCSVAQDSSLDQRVYHMQFFNLWPMNTVTVCYGSIPHRTRGTEHTTSVFTLRDAKHGEANCDIVRATYLELL